MYLDLIIEYVFNNVKSFFDKYYIMRISELNPNRPRVLGAVNDYYNTKEPRYNMSIKADLDPANKQLIQSLKTLGWEFKNYGAFSAVFVNPSRNYIIKINRRQDTGFSAFVNLVKRNPKQPHFPKISYRKKIEVGDTIHEIYLIEKLEPFPPAESYSVDNVRILTGDITHIANNYLAPIDKIFNSEEIKVVKQYPPSLITAARLIGKTAVGHDLRLDIHRNNLMIRPNGNTIIIADPFINRWDL